MSNIIILYGGPSSEREVSYNSKDYFLDLYKSQNPILVEWLEDGCFIFLTSNSIVPAKTGIAYSEDNFLNVLKDNPNLIVILAGHGEYIEDGYIQKKFEAAGIKFTGSSSTSCYLAMNKYKSQEVAKKFVKTIPTYIEFPSKFKLKQLVKEIGSTFPIFIKPNNLGSSVGAHLIENKEQLISVLKDLPNIPYIFQKYIEGLELSVGSVRRNINGFLNLPITAIYPSSSKFFDYTEKYSSNGAKEVTPANIDKDTTKKIKLAANAIHNALGLGFYSRSDFILTKDNTLYYLETNPLPGMSKTSIVPQQLKISNNIGNFKNNLIKFVN